jgi:hypothetical protein
VPLAAQYEKFIGTKMISIGAVNVIVMVLLKPA